jgi:small subunit ribosomal protein S3
MAVEKHFVEEGIREADIEEYLSKEFDRAGYSHIEIQRTPLGTRIIVYANRPGLVIGRSGSRIKEMTDNIQRKFKLENPMLDVREVDNPFLDAQVVANNITKSLERGGFYKKVANYYIDEIMKAGAVGVQIRIGGRLGGEKSRFHKFNKGYIKHSGYYADNLVDKGKATATTKPGIIGVQVKILKEIPEEELKIIEEKKVEKIEDKGNEKTKA